jgi:hypothetical protein
LEVVFVEQDILYLYQPLISPLDGVNFSYISRFSFAALTNKHLLPEDFFSMKIHHYETDGAQQFLHVVPGGGIGDFLLNFKMGEFCKKVKGLMQVLHIISFIG